MAVRSPYTENTFFDRAFPTPSYLTLPAVGIDISDYSIKHLYLRRGSRRVELVSYGKIDLPLGTVEQGEIKDMETLVKLLTRLREQQGYQFAHLSLPEAHAYLFHTQLPAEDPAKADQLLEARLKENVPLSADEAVFDHTVVRVAGESAEHNVSVYPAVIAGMYVEALESAGFNVLSVEIEGQATARALLAADGAGTELVIDVGRNEASLSISTDGVVTFTANLETGGDIFTRAIARKLDLSFQEAEKLKREHGFRDLKDSGPIYAALLPVMADLKESIKKHLMYWQMHVESVQSEEGAVARIVLAGGNANIAGLPEYLAAGLGVPVEIGNVWRNIYSFEEYVPPISANESLEYATVMGLALRSLLRLG